MKKDYHLKDVVNFLQESNLIEGVNDDRALRQALNAWEYLLTVSTLTPTVILNTHKILMTYQPLEPRYKGKFRDCDVMVGSRVCIPYSCVPGDIRDWCSKVNHHHTKIDDPLDPIALHVEYEKIHPFVDGNGRTGRLFLNWTRLKKTKQEILIIEANRRQDYYKWFQ